MFEMGNTSSRQKTDMYSYYCMGELGSGSFGTVYKVKKVDGKDLNKTYALKMINKKQLNTQHQINQAKREQDILIQARESPFCVGLYYSFVSTNHLCLIMDCVQGVELYELLFSSENECKHTIVKTPGFLMAELVSTLGYLHGKGIVYRDLKFENVMMQTNGHMKLVDFSLSKIIKDKKTSTFCGTPEILAPEIILREDYGKEVDVWSLGVFFFELVSETALFCSEYLDETIFDQIVNCRPIEKLLRERHPKFKNKNALDLILKMMKYSPEDRLTIPEIKEHVYFEGVKWDYVENFCYKSPYKPSAVDIRKTRFEYEDLCKDSVYADFNYTHPDL